MSLRALEHQVIWNESKVKRGRCKVNENLASIEERWKKTMDAYVMNTSVWDFVFYSLFRFFLLFCLKLSEREWEKGNVRGPTTNNDNVYNRVLICRLLFLLSRQFSSVFLLIFFLSNCEGVFNSGKLKRRLTETWQ